MDFACRARGDDPEIDIRFLDARPLAVETCENLDHFFKLVIDADRHNLAIANLSYAVKARVHLHGIHAVTQAFDLDLFRETLKLFLIVFSTRIEHKKFADRHIA